jgi:hypothetical protein
MVGLVGCDGVVADGAMGLVGRVMGGEDVGHVAHAVDDDTESFFGQGRSRRILGTFVAAA